MTLRLCVSLRSISLQGSNISVARMPAPLNLNKRFASDANRPRAAARSLLKDVVNPPTATSILQDADARERTLAIHGVVAGSMDALIEEMRTCGHIVRVVRSKRCVTTLFVTFGSALAAKAAQELQGNTVVDGQRFAVTVGALPDDEVEDGANGVGVAGPIGGVRVMSPSPRKPVQPSSSPSQQAKGAVDVVTRFQKVKFSYLSCLPFADRWLTPLLQRSTAVDGASRKRARGE